MRVVIQVTQQGEKPITSDQILMRELWNVWMQDDKAHQRYRRFRAIRDHAAQLGFFFLSRRSLAAAASNPPSMGLRRISPLLNSGPSQDAQVLSLPAAPGSDRQRVVDIESPLSSEQTKGTPGLIGVDGSQVAMSRLASRKPAAEAQWVLHDFHNDIPAAPADSLLEANSASINGISASTTGAEFRPKLETAMLEAPVLGSTSAVTTGTVQEDCGIEPYLPNLQVDRLTEAFAGVGLNSYLTVSQDTILLHRMLSKGPGNPDFDAAAAKVAEALGNPLWKVGGYL